MKEVYINDVLLDLSEKDSPIALTYEVNNLAELKDRQAFTSNNFKVPTTSNNRRACGFPDVGNIIGLQPYRKNSCRIIQDGVEILTNGIALITGTGKDINIQALSGIIGFFSSLEGKNIRDLDLSAYDHYWILQTVINSQSNTEGYVYPIIDYGNLGFDNIIFTDLLRPATFYKTVFIQMMLESGFVWEGAIDNDELFNKMLIPFANEKFEHGKDYGGTSLNVEARSVQDVALNNNFQERLITFGDDNGTDPSGSWSGTEYTSQDITKVKISLLYDIDTRDTYKGGSPPHADINIDKFSSGSWNKIAINPHYCEGEFNTVKYNNQKLEVETDLKVGDKIRVTLRYTPIDRMRATVYAGAKINIETLKQDVVYGQEIQLSATLPDMSQTDFFKEFLQLFGLIAIPYSFEKKIKLISMDDVYANKPLANDWTEKFIDSGIDYDYKFGSYGINNHGKYKEDENVNPELGIGKLVFDNQTLKNDHDLFTSKFSATESVNRLGGVEVARINKIQDPNESLDYKLKTQPRLLVDRKISIGRILFIDPENNFTPVTYPLSIPLFDGLDYQTLFDKYYSNYLRMLFRPLVLEREILLNSVDIQKLDFSIPIFDELTGSYYYCNGIKSWISGEPCIISLVKMP